MIRLSIFLFGTSRSTTGKPSILQVHLKSVQNRPFPSWSGCVSWENSLPTYRNGSLLVSVEWSFFAYKDDKKLMRESLVVRIWCKYSGHSFRSGAATTALKAGISDATIQMLGCWRSDAYKRYMYFKTPGRPIGGILSAPSSAITHYIYC